MPHLSAHAVQQPLYNFLQLAVGSDLQTLNDVPFSTDAEQWLFNRLAESALPIKEAIQLEPSKKRVLAELLKQYVMFLSMNEHLLFEADFLKATSETKLGLPLLRYIAKHRWPFPQMLPQ